MTTAQTRNPPFPNPEPLDLVQMYSRTFTLLHQYDEGTLPNQSALESKLKHFAEGEGQGGSS